MRSRIFSTMNQLQRNLLYLIQKRGINPTILAKEAGVQQPTLHRILSGESEDPRTATLQPLADYFNCTVEYLRTAAIDSEDVVRDQFFKDIDSGKIDVAEEMARSEAAQLAAKEERRTYVLSTIREHNREAAAFRRGAVVSLMNSLRTMAPSIKEEAVISLHSFSARADLLGEKVCAEIKFLPSPEFATLMSAAKTIEAGIFQLTTLRSMLKGTGHSCEHFVLIIGPSNLLDPTTLNKSLQLAAVHGVMVVIVDRPLEAAGLLADLEAGRGLTLTNNEEDTPL